MTQKSTRALTQRGGSLSHELLQLPVVAGILKRDVPHAYTCMMLSLQSPGEEVSVKLVDPAGADVVAAGSLDAVEARLREVWHLGPRMAGGGGGGVQV